MPVGTARNHSHAGGNRFSSGWSSVTADIQPDRHGSSANYLYADGHVESIRAARLKALIEATNNFAKPPQ